MPVVCSYFGQWNNASKKPITIYHACAEVGHAKLLRFYLTYVARGQDEKVFNDPLVCYCLLQANDLGMLQVCIDIGLPSLTMVRLYAHRDDSLDLLAYFVEKKYNIENMRVSISYHGKEKVEHWLREYRAIVSLLTISLNRI